MEIFSNSHPSWLKLCADLETEEHLPFAAALPAAPSQFALRLPMEELFHVGPDGLEDLSDSTLEFRVDELRANLTRGLMAVPEAIEMLSQSAPLEAV